MKKSIANRLFTCDGVKQFIYQLHHTTIAKPKPLLYRGIETIEVTPPSLQTYDQLLKKGECISLMTHRYQMDDYLKRLRLQTILAQLDAYVREANEQQIGYETFLFHLLSIEVAEREVKKKEGLRRKAQFPLEKDLISFRFEEAPFTN